VTLSLVLLGIAATAAPQVKAQSLYFTGNAYEDYAIQIESSGRINAVNPYSGACGFLQSYPCSKLAGVCPYWYADPACQQRYFTQDMLNRYGSWYRVYVHEYYYKWW
jgi:hypothetical protein